MSDTNGATPIYDGVGHEGKKPLLTEARRRAIYRVVAAVVALLAVYFGVDAVHQELWLNLAGAILMVSGTGAAVLADRNVR